MGKIVVEYAGTLPDEVIRALAKDWNVQGRGVRPKLFTDNRISCSRLTHRAVRDLLEKGGVSVTQVVVFEHGGSTKTIRMGDGGQKKVGVERSILTPWRQLIRTTPVAVYEETTSLVVYSLDGMSEKDKKAEQTFHERLNGLEDQGLKDGLHSVLTTIVDELNPALKSTTLRKWHLVHFPRKRKDEKLTPAILLKPLEDSVPGLYSVAVEYVQAYQQGLSVYRDLGRDPLDSGAMREFMSPVMAGPQDQLETAILEVMEDRNLFQAVGSLVN